jgi:ABC-type branched-subunit amino acid transport system ATPase component
MVFIQVRPVVMLTTSHTTTTGMLAVLSHTTVTGGDVTAAVEEELSAFLRSQKRMEQRKKNSTSHSLFPRLRKTSRHGCGFVVGDELLLSVILRGLRSGVGKTR